MQSLTTKWKRGNRETEESLESELTSCSSRARGYSSTRGLFLSYAGVKSFSLMCGDMEMEKFQSSLINDFCVCEIQ